MTELVTLLKDTVREPPRLVQGGVLLQRQPDVAPRAYVHRVFNPVPLCLARTLPFTGSAWKRHADGLLRDMNGCRLFGGAFVLTGVCSSSIDTEADLGQPIDVRYGNLWDRPRLMATEDCVIGFEVGSSKTLPIVLSGNDFSPSLYDPSGRYMTCRWGSVDEMLKSEVIRMQSIFDESGHLRDSDQPTLPPEALTWDTAD